MERLNIPALEKLLLDHNPQIEWDIMTLSTRIKRLQINGRVIRYLRPDAFKQPLSEIFAEVPEETHIVIPREGTVLSMLSYEYMMRDQYQVLLFSLEWPELREGDFIEVVEPRLRNNCQWCWDKWEMSKGEPGFHDVEADGVYSEVRCRNYVEG